MKYSSSARRVIAWLAVAACLTQDTAAAQKPELLPEELLKEGWIQLFDGHSLFGWQASTDANWRVEDGAIVVDSGERGLLCTTSRFQDFELHLQFRCPADTNSGIFVRTPSRPSNPAKDCYEINIAPQDNPFPTGGIVMRERGDPPSLLPNEWHDYDIRVEQGRVITYVDGVEVCRYEDPDPLPPGLIGLQLNQGRIAFRDVRLRPLLLRPLYNGKDLSGWNTDRAEESRFEVTDAGELQVLDGRGQLETNKQFADFVMQLACYVDGDQLNSGIFFRCIPGDFMNGYESQIHNGIRQDDPTKPVDCGTGGIFRRQNARRVVAEDRQWFYKTIIADGPHLAVWVNGYQVSDWTDTRDEHENPRQGKRLAAGTICIQGHDPTTNLLFRGLMIAEIEAP